MPYNLIFIDESESMQRAVATIFLNNPEFKLVLVGEPSSVFEAARNFIPDIIVLSYNTIDVELKKSITEIKTSREFLNIPLVLLVPSDLSDNEREALAQLKADGFIYRPFDKDSFISKIKKAVGDSKTNASAAENEEKIYDISFFENKKIPSPDIAAAVPFPSNAGQSASGLSAAEPILSEALSVPAGTNEASENGDIKPAEINSESSELNNAFENLFKDDKVFKEFHDLNNHEDGADKVVYLQEEEPAIPEASTFQATATEFPSPQEILNLDETEPDMPNKLSEIIKIDNLTAAPDEQSAADYSGQDGTFDIAPQNNYGNTDDFNEFKTIKDLDAKKSEREFDLKILDEQIIVKLDDYLKNTIEKTFEEIKPQIIETIQNSLPEIIERLVKEEIEKIKQL